MFDISTEPLLFDLYYGGKSAIETLDEGVRTPKTEVLPKVDETTPVFKDIYITNVTCSGAKRAMFFNGLPEKNIVNINIENLTVNSDNGGEIVESENIKLKNVKIIAEKGSPLVLRNVKNVEIDGFTTAENVNTIFEVQGNKTKNVTIKSVYGKEKATIAKDVNKAVLKMSKTK